MFAAERIGKDAVVIEFEREWVSTEEENQRETVYAQRDWTEDFMLTVRDCDVKIDHTTYGNRARYANHLCNPSTGFLTYSLYG